MLEPTTATLRFLMSWLTARQPPPEEEVRVEVAGRSIPCTLLGRREGGGALPGWVLLHGVTRTGRAHPTLTRFARALASTPALVLVPEVPEWIDLQLGPAPAFPILGEAAATLRALPEVGGRRIGLIGFSFGCPQALVAAARPELREHVASVVGFGGYADMGRTVRFLFTGHHEWRGRSYRTKPDPYGRWVVGANYLTASEGYESAVDVAQALQKLALTAGDWQVAAWDARYEPLKQQLRAEVTPAHRALFDLFAGERDTPIRESDTANLITGLAAAARRVDPPTDPLPFLGQLSVPVRLIHGRRDQLIPFTEGLRLGEAVGRVTDVRTTITDLFSHSHGRPASAGLTVVREGFRFVHALWAALATAYAAAREG